MTLTVAAVLYLLAAISFALSMLGGRLSVLLNAGLALLAAAHLAP